MRPRVEVDSRLKSILQGTEREARVAVRAGVREATTDLKDAWRGQVKSAGMGNRLANTIRSQIYPRQPSTSAAGLVWTRAPVIVEAHSRGALITTDRGRFLAIPTSSVRRYRGSGSRKLTPAQWELLNNRRLHFVPQRNGTALLVDRGGDPIRSQIRGRDGRVRNVRRRKLRTIGTVIFVLVRQARLRKRIELDRPAEMAARRLPGLIVNRWPR